MDCFFLLDRSQASELFARNWAYDKTLREETSFRTRIPFKDDDERAYIIEGHMRHESSNDWTFTLKTMTCFCGLESLEYCDCDPMCFRRCTSRCVSSPTVSSKAFVTGLEAPVLEEVHTAEHMVALGEERIESLDKKGVHYLECTCDDCMKESKIETVPPAILQERSLCLACGLSQASTSAGLRNAKTARTRTRYISTIEALRLDLKQRNPVIAHITT